MNNFVIESKNLDTLSTVATRTVIADLADARQIQYYNPFDNCKVYLIS